MEYLQSFVSSLLKKALVESHEKGKDKQMTHSANASDKPRGESLAGELLLKLAVEGKLWDRKCDGLAADKTT